MPILEIITIGTELLLGEITDTNSTYIARTLRDHGIDIYRITTIGDNPGRIAATIQEALLRADIIITTGGLGPTIDDPTRLAVANAVNRPLVFHDDLWQEIVDRFQNFGRKPTENNRRQAYIPEGALPVHNPVGTAPCFIVEQEAHFIISLPGVPLEMKTILHGEIIPFLVDRFQLRTQIIKATVLHVASLGESVIDEKIADLEQRANPTVGLLAHPGQVDIRITAKASSEQEADGMITPILKDLQQRLGENIYGQDEDTLGSVIAAFLEENSLKLQLITYGFDETLKEKIKPAEVNIRPLQWNHSHQPDLSDLANAVDEAQQVASNGITFGLALVLDERIALYLVYQDANNKTSQTRFYGGPRGDAHRWSGHIALDFLRRTMIKFNS
ncbi:MAG: competence/damage-inducible protein A [Brevefilum sp.]